MKPPKYYTEDLREIDFYGVLEEQLEYLYQELFKTHSDVISRQIEALERVKDEATHS